MNFLKGPKGKKGPPVYIGQPGPPGRLDHYLDQSDLLALKVFLEKEDRQEKEALQVILICY